MEFYKEIYIDGRLISEKGKTFIIAEAGVNHGGDVELAKKLVDIAAEAQVDAVKFQAFRTDKLILNTVKKADYQIQNTKNEDSQASMLRKLELNLDAYIELKSYCESKGILFLITPFDEESLKELESIDIPAYKIASTDTTNLLFLKKIAQTNKPVFLSTGMCDIEEVDKAVKIFKEINLKLILLQCTANYPISDNEADLLVLNQYKERYGCLLGYSDHSVGLGAAIYSLPLGAKVVEKHFTIDKSANGPDHSASLSPSELKSFVKEIRRCEQFLSNSMKRITPGEISNKKSLQKSLVASKEIIQGEVFSTTNIVAKRAGGNGVSAIHGLDYIGKIAKKNYLTDELID
ncbi:MAG: N-acetylneuraminate synthase [Flavobacteriales bacterium]|nr:MAG: N-acetylneuraminate synthase [Flavobacteriales bacterium]